MTKKNRIRLAKHFKSMGIKKHPYFKDLQEKSTEHQNPPQQKDQEGENAGV